ncbi:ATP-binding protein [Cytobacillus spongiae]|uniref:ATP-binding protein n=1 Tax=Cytobacillus spongiae TaxID=2901381 RepID=UPI001F209A11|nr:ATP-binding protein [Cytobacillus spongiae]UII57805.1 ATP-binding protein [Cytobacillus spongiae]
MRKFLFIDDCFRDGVRRKVPELKDRNDFEVKFCREILPCTHCSKGKSDSFFYRIKENWIQVDEPNKCSKCRDRETYEVYQKDSLSDSKRLLGERLTNEYFHIPEVLKGAGFRDYQETNKVTARAKADVIRFTKDFLDTENNRRNLLIMGNTGTGKTHLCAAAARTIKEKGFTVGFLTTGQLLTIIKSTYNKASMKTEEEILQDIKKFDLLILDDLGSEAIGGNDDWRKGMIFEVVESRSGKPTIYTSNMTDTDLPAAVGPRVFSRLHDNTKFIDLFTGDYRKRLQIK